MLTGEVYREGGQKISEANLSIQGQALTALDAFIERAVAKDSAHRFRSMEELGEAFSSLLEKLDAERGPLGFDEATVRRSRRHYGPLNAPIGDSDGRWWGPIGGQVVYKRLCSVIG